MAKYRKVDPRVWNDDKFCSLSDPAKLVFLFVLTHPHMTALGAMRHSIAGMAAELNKPEEGFRKAFGEALAKGLIQHDQKANFVWLPNFLKYNRPESPNVVKGWGDSLDLLPECKLKVELIKRVKGFTEALHKAFSEALPEGFSEAFRKTSPYQEQEQEQEQDSIPKPRNKTELFTPEEKEEPDRARKSNPVWDLIAKLWFEGEVAQAHRTRVGKLVKDFTSLGATPEEIHERLNRYRSTWPRAESSPEALVKHWVRFAGSSTGFGAEEISIFERKRAGESIDLHPAKQARYNAWLGANSVQVGVGK